MDTSTGASLDPTDRIVDPGRLAERLDRERARFTDTHPRSAACAAAARAHLVGGVPMNWMVRWAGGFPLTIDWARGARFADVDGHEYIDFCLGDTGAMCGHAPEPTVRAVTEQAAKGITTMLPNTFAPEVATEMARRFGLPLWQFCLTATDANRFVVRLARMITGRPRILVHNGCYHGTVDETVARLIDGEVRPRPGSVGPPVDPAVTTRIVEFNDLDALEAELAHGDVALVLAEPAMTNIGIVLPDPGYHEALRELTRRHGTLLCIDETHTICCGPGGATGAWGLAPDFLTIGKPIGGGIPSAAYGMSTEVADRWAAMTEIDTADVGGIGGTLAGNVLSLAAMRATLTEVLTDAAFTRMMELAERFEDGVNEVITRRGLPWHVTRLGCRVEYRFAPTPPRNGGEAIAADDARMDEFMHLFALNRGILMTPFHNMALMCPATTEADVDRHTEVFDDAAGALFD